MVKRTKPKAKNGKNGHSNGNGADRSSVAVDRPVGRPSKYQPEYARQAAKLCRLGATDAELSDFFQVTISTIQLWMVQQPEFSDAVKELKGVANDLMERSLYMKGRGFYIDAEKVFLDKFGDVIRVPTREYYPPDTAAAFIWLKNRRPDKWRDKHEIEHGGKIEHKFTLEIFEHDVGMKIIDSHAQTKKLVPRLRSNE